MTWDNRTLDWGALARRCSEVQRTPETAAEYAAMPRDRQGDIKDVGGFVGGRLVDGRRRKGAVAYRTVLTLDADFAGEDFISRCSAALPGRAWVVYSTHKHSAAQARMRLVAPLSRRVSAAEYVRVARAVAERVGMEQFDQTSFEPERLMYWPSASADAPFVFKEHAGAAVDVAEFLDSSEVVRSEAVRSEVARSEVVSTEHCPDPRDKEGAVGAFCRTYDIHEAIAKYLPAVFEPTAARSRYTYCGGTTSGGAVVYDDLWLYSHHDSDPWAGRLLNAFDLVRLHLYGAEDAGVEAQTSALPSYRRMEALCADDEQVAKAMLIERATRAATDLAGVDMVDAISPGDVDWRDELDCDKRGRVRSTMANVVAILEHDPLLRGRLRYDEFAEIDTVRGGLPWDRGAQTWSNADDARLRVYLERKYGITGVNIVADGLTEVFQRHRFNPVRDYLESVKWDGVPRLEKLLIDMLGAEDTPYVRAATRVHFVASVARIYEPGCKYDYCLTICGPEGAGKSTLFAVMYGEWHNDSISSLDGKTPMEQLAGTWCAELAELTGMNRSEVERVKQFITSRVDTYRGAYQRRSEPHKRKCVFAATTNERAFLRSNTGNRRFNVVEAVPERSLWPDTPSRIGALRADRDQLWAEAVAMYRDGASLYLSGDVAEEARRVQDAHNVDVDDPMRARLEWYLERKLPADWNGRDLARRRAWYTNPDPVEEDTATERRDAVCPTEFLAEAMGIDVTNARALREQTNRVTRYLADLGWERGTTSRRVESMYGRQKDWRRPE